VYFFAANDTSTDRLALIESQFEGYRFIKRGKADLKIRKILKRLQQIIK